jgi:hypothetical protein
MLYFVMTYLCEKVQTLIRGTCLYIFYRCGGCMLQVYFAAPLAVELHVEYHRTHWRKFEEVYAEYFASLAASTSNEGRTLDASVTGLIVDCNMRHNCAQITHVLWHFG